MITWYVIDTRTDKIINAIETSGIKPDIERFIDSEWLELETNPPVAQLHAYRYWNERP